MIDLCGRDTPEWVLYKERGDNTDKAETQPKFLIVGEARKRTFCPFDNPPAPFGRRGFEISYPLAHSAKVSSSEFRVPALGSTARLGGHVTRDRNAKTGHQDRSRDLIHHRSQRF